MNNEFNGNQPEEMDSREMNSVEANDNQYDRNNLNNQNEESNSEESIYSYVSSNIIQDNNQADYNTNSQQYDDQSNYFYHADTNNPSNNPYTVYPTPQIEEKAKSKPKRNKKRFLPAAKLVAAALVFGLVAGGAFQAYYMLARPDSSKTDNINTGYNAQIAEITQDTDTDSTIQTSTASDTTSTVVTDVSDVVKQVMPSIVAINSEVTTTTTDFFGRQYEQEGQSSGSGIIIGQNDSKLLIVTNNHVIDGAASIQIVFTDKKTATATVKGADANADLAVLSVDMDQLSEDTAAAIKIATLGSSDDMEPGDMAIAIGNALGYGQSVTVGYISAVNREVTIEDQKMTLLQTDAAINPGNSGGALLNTKGEVVGINSVKFASEEVEGMGYAIPISSAIPMINELMNREVVSASEQGFLGIDSSTAQDVTEVYAARFNMPIGVYVNDVVNDSPAEKAGLMQGDIITGLDGFTIETMDDLKNALSYKKTGQTIELTIQTIENGAYTEKVLSIALGSK